MGKLTGIIIALIMVVLLSGPVTADDKALVRVFADGQKHITSVNEATVGQVLENLGIDVEEKDLVEPNLEHNIDEDVFNINVYRAQPVIIIDGNKRIESESAYTSGKEMAVDSGIKVNPKDKFTVKPVENFLTEGRVGLKVIIDRSTPYTVNEFGEKYEAFTHQNTVREALAEEGIDITEADLIEPALSEKLTEGTVVNLFKEGTVEVIEEERVEFTTKTVIDDSLDAGVRKTKTEGKDGLREVTYEIFMRNGEELSKTEISSKVLKESVQEVVRVGPAAASTSVSSTHADAATKQSWLAAAGIAQSNWAAADILVGHESSWNPNAVNPFSGACGLGQQLPCGKWDSYGAWNDPVAALKAMNNYVQGYGGWQQALAFWGCTGECYSARTGGTVYKSATWY